LASGKSCGGDFSARVNREVRGGDEASEGAEQAAVGGSMTRADIADLAWPVRDLRSCRFFEQAG